MDQGAPLQACLDAWTHEGEHGEAVGAVVGRLAEACIKLGRTIARGSLDGDPARPVGQGAGGDLQKALDVEANDLFRDALRRAPVAAFASEENDGIEMLEAAGPLVVAIDPVDGSGNIALNLPVGTIFSVSPQGASGAEAPCWPAGTAQLAAGFVLYGPQTTMIVTVGPTVDRFTLDPDAGFFRLTRADIRLPAAAPDEYAVNASNYRYWEEPVRAHVDEFLAGASGPYGRDFNMRWHGALVADAYRVLERGGLYLYPADARDGYGNGRLRLVYEAYAMALLVERAGGAATDGRRRILDLPARDLHQRVPLILGTTSMVERLTGSHDRPGLWPPHTPPLFATRSLFRS